MQQKAPRQIREDDAQGPAAEVDHGREDWHHLGSEENHMLNIGNEKSKTRWETFYKIQYSKWSLELN